MKKIALIAALGSSLALIFPDHSAYAAAGKNSGKNGNRIEFNTSDTQLKKTKVNLKDKIEGSIQAIANRLEYLKQNIASTRTSKRGMTMDELKSMALSIKSDMDKAREDVNNYMMNGDIFMSERDNYFQKIAGLQKILGDFRIISAEDLNKS